MTSQTVISGLPELPEVLSKAIQTAVDAVQVINNYPDRGLAQLAHGRAMIEINASLARAQIGSALDCLGERRSRLQ